MTDEMSFEDRLAAALDQYADRAPTAVDVRELIGATRAGSRSPRWTVAPTRWSFGRTRSRLGLALVLALVTILATVAVLAVGSQVMRREPSLVVGPSPSPTASVAAPGGGGRLLAYAPRPSSGRDSGGTATAILSDGRSLGSYTGSMSGCPHLVAGLPGLVVQPTGFRHRYVIHPFDGESWSPFPASIAHHNGSSYSEWWAPGHRRILQVAYGVGIDVVSLGDTQASTEVWYPVPGVTGVAWAEDGRRLAVSVDVGSDSEVRILDPETGAWRTVARITPTMNAEVRGPIWVPGRDALLLPLSDGIAADFARIDVASGAVSAQVQGRYPLALSPDGTRMLVSDSTAGWALIDADGSNAVALGPEPIDQREPRDGSTGYGGAARWSPDGSHLAYIAGDELIVLRSDGSGRVTAPIAGGTFAWSPDGTMVAIARMTSDGGATVELASISDLAARTPVATVPGPGGVIDDGSLPPVVPCLEWEAPSAP